MCKDISQFLSSICVTTGEFMRDLCFCYITKVLLSANFTFRNTAGETEKSSLISELNCVCVTYLRSSGCVLEMHLLCAGRILLHFDIFFPQSPLCLCSLCEYQHSVSRGSVIPEHRHLVVDLGRTRGSSAAPVVGITLMSECWILLQTDYWMSLFHVEPQV